jgi:hypothetical protein
MKEFPAAARLGVYAFFQLLAFGYVVIIRPFDNWKDNTVEILNDWVYFGIVVALSAVEMKRFRDDMVCTIIIYVIMANGFLITLIITVDSIISFVKYFKKKQKSKKIGANENKIKPLEESKDVMVREITRKTTFRDILPGPDVVGYNNQEINIDNVNFDEQNNRQQSKVWPTVDYSKKLYSRLSQVNIRLYSLNIIVSINGMFLIIDKNYSNAIYEFSIFLFLKNIILLYDNINYCD